MFINLQQYGVVIRVAIFPSQLPKYCQTNLKSVAKNLNFYNFTNVSNWSVFSQFTIFPNGFDCSVPSILPSSNRVPSFQRIIMVPIQMGITGWLNPPFSDISKYHIYIYLYLLVIQCYISWLNPRIPYTHYIAIAFVLLPFSCEQKGNSTECNSTHSVIPIVYQ